MDFIFCRRQMGPLLSGRLIISMTESSSYDGERAILLLVQESKRGYFVLNTDITCSARVGDELNPVI